MTSNCDVTKSEQKMQMTTITPLIEISDDENENFLRAPLAESGRLIP